MTSHLFMNIELKTEWASTEELKDQVWVSIRTLSKLRDLSTKTLRRMNKDGEIKLYRIRGKLFAKLNEVNEDINQLAEPVF